MDSSAPNVLISSPFSGKKLSKLLKLLKSPFIISIIALFAVISLSILIWQIVSPSKKLPSQRQEGKVVTLTNELLRTAPKLEKAATSEEKAEITTKMVAIAQERKVEALKEIENDPQAFLTHALPDEVRTALPLEVQPQVEREVELQGNLTVIHEDDFVNCQVPIS